MCQLHVTPHHRDAVHVDVMASVHQTAGTGQRAPRTSGSVGCTCNCSAVRRRLSPHPQVGLQREEQVVLEWRQQRAPLIAGRARPGQLILQEYVC